MTPKEYIQKALVTESDTYAPATERFTEDMVRLLHACMGISTEAGEILDQMKKHLYYGKPLDTVNLKEEMGDLFWYMAIMSDSLGIDFEEAMNTNISKLKARYGEKFSEDKAIHRDLDKERTILSK